MPFFSIIIPLYNKENFIVKTINSALRQTFSNFEIIIINDGSTDESLNRLKIVNDKRIRIFDIPNSGVSAARNYGIKKSKSKMIALLDADDIWEKNHLEELYNLWLENPSCGLYCMAYAKRFNNKKKYRAKIYGLNNFSGVVSDFFASSRVDCVAWTSAVMIPKKTIKKIGYFNQNLRSGQDTDLWIRIATKEKVAFSSKITSNKIINFREYHLSKSKYISDRLKIFELHKLEEEKNLSLKKFLDLNRFSMAIERKEHGDFKNYFILKKNINKKNLNFNQKALLKLPGFMLVFLKKIQKALLKINIYLTIYE